MAQWPGVILLDCHAMSIRFECHLRSHYYYLSLFTHSFKIHGFWEGRRLQENMEVFWGRQSQLQSADADGGQPRRQWDALNLHYKVYNISWFFLQPCSHCISYPRGMQPWGRPVRDFFKPMVTLAHLPGEIRGIVWKTQPFPRGWPQGTEKWHC